MESRNQEKHSPSFVYCLSIDLIGSTKAGLEMTTTGWHDFNKALVAQINKPRLNGRSHLANLDLLNILIKFTGDGWLLMTTELDEVPALCCFAIIMARKFQDEMSEEPGINRENVSALRLAICSGPDIAVQLPDGRKDWVGDSARRAVRASKCCNPNEILIDETVRSNVMRDCDVEDAVQQSQKLKETEEQFPIYVLKGLKAKLAIESGTQACFVYTLGVIGKPEEVKEVAKAGAKRLADEASQLRIVEEKESLKQNLRQWNRLMASLPDYASALDLLGSMKEAKVQPDVFTHSTLISKAPDFTYSTLISKAPDYEAAKGWLERMTAEGIQPNVFTYSTLISKAPDYEAAKGWLERMTAEGIQPNVFTYSTLISKAPDYEAAKGWLERMTAEGIQPDVFTYSTLISKAPDYEAAKGWLERMTAEGIQPDVFTYSMLISKAPDYKAAKGWLERMTAEGIQPDVFTYSMLISKAPDYKAAKGWLERMTAEGIQPNVFTYSTLFSKDLSKQSADDLLKWYLDQKYHPEEPIQAAIAVYRRSRHLDQALRLALDYPHLEAARKLIRDYPEKALAYFRAISEHDPQHRNAEYALGVALMELGKKREAEPHLRKALKLAKTGPRELAIKEWLHQIEIDRPSQNE